MANIFNGSCNIIIIGRTGPFIYRVNSKSEYCFLASALKTGKKGLRLHAPSALNDFIVCASSLNKKENFMQKMFIFYSSETYKIEIRLEYDHFYS